MNKPVFYIIFLLCCFTSSGQQNLVPNPSFEEYWSCPTSNDLNDGQLEKCKYWWKPTFGGTSDYFNSCNTSIVSVPDNFWGHQEAYEGNGYVGIVPVCWFSNGEFCGYEYIQTKLKQPLRPCTKYRFQMAVCLAEYSTHSIGKLGAVMTIDSFYYNSDDVIEIIPQVYNKNGIIQDSINWTIIDEVFLANGSEEYLTIGYFFSNLLDDTTFIQDYSVGSYAPYYYIDNIVLTEIEVVDNCNFNIPNVFTPNNDGSNDFWKFNAPIEGELSILNRWGETIYHSIGTKFSWDGEKSTEGVYYYIFKTGQDIKTGFIQLIK